MSDIAIHVENLSKLYHIGARQKRHDTLRDQIADFGLQIADWGKRVLKSEIINHKSEIDMIWALKDVSFEVKQGEVVGIIGRNGAGKSTLLKILSRITKPTSGHARLYGRVGSLLEVGTGFHSELTGRENIYLSGAIMGMKKAEIDRKFDEIVAFSEVEKFIDTPVKRYSSGMYVRLAFAVAAHLEPEILLVDEVLAVGDAAFQKKCLGKMGDVAREGRTVLFVSHNMAVIENLCPRTILIYKGTIRMDGTSRGVLNDYLTQISTLTKTSLVDRSDRRGVGELRAIAIEIVDDESRRIEHATSGRELIIRVHYRSHNRRWFKNCRVSVAVRKEEQAYFLLSTELVYPERIDLPGSGYIDCVIPQLPLSGGTYQLEIFIEANGEVQDWVQGAANLSVIDADFYGTGRNYPSGWQGKGVLVNHHWRLGSNLKDSSCD